MRKLIIDGKTIQDNGNAYVIAEIGHNHQGDLETAKKLVAARGLPRGHAIRPEDIAIKSPGDGLPPYEFDKVVGRTTICDLKADDDITFEVLNGAELKAKAAA